VVILASPKTEGHSPKRWLDGVPGLDHATLNDVTPNYCAKPMFVGRPDPVPVRSRLVAGAADAVRVPPLPGPPAKAAGINATAAPPSGIGLARAERYAFAAIRAVAAAPSGNGRETCTRVALKLYSLAKHGLLDATDITRRLKDAMLARGWDNDEQTRGDTLADVSRQLQCAWQHAQAAGLPDAR
jgi:hypothetical protein